MAKRTKTAPARRPVQVTRRFMRATGSDDPQLAEVLVGQLLQSLWLPDEPGELPIKDRVAAAIGALEGIGPRDTTEAMLAVQMVATHGAAMECVRRAMLPTQPGPAIDIYLRHSAKLLDLYARQCRALDRRRGTGGQKVTVEHVQVEPGGQAIVGNVRSTPPRQDVR